jgi:Na+-translocating ferredoxin:NAD+ oxidoreductase RnfG subunit
MKYLSILLVCLCFSWSFTVPDRVEKKANKEIIKHYNIKDFDKETIPISEEINSNSPSEFGDENLFRIISKGELIGYGYIGSAEAKVSNFDYLVIFDADLIIVKTKVLIYREEYGGEISSKRWLKQFIGISSSSSELIYKKDIIPISGATISVRSMTRAINNLLKSIKILQYKEIL